MDTLYDANSLSPEEGANPCGYLCFTFSIISYLSTSYLPHSKHPVSIEKLVSYQIKRGFSSLNLPLIFSSICMLHFDF